MLKALVLLSVLPQTLITAKRTIESETRSLDEIYEVALQETGPLRVVLGGSSVSAGTGLLNGWRERFPGLELNLTVDLSKYANNRIDRAYLNGEPPYVDVAYLQTVHDFRRWKSEGRLLNYKAPNFDDVNNALKDPDGAFISGQIYQFGPFYFDALRVPEDLIPQNYMDILDPYWRRKLVLVPPHDDDGVLYLFKLIIEKYGFEWLERLHQQDVLWLRGSAGPAYTIAERADPEHSERVLTFTTLGYPPDPASLNKTFPEDSEGFMSWGQTCAIFKDTTRPESAKLFQAFLLSDEWQSSLIGANPAVRNSLIKTPEQDIWKQNNTQVTGYTEFMLDRANVEWWRFQLETTLGLPEGPNPVQVYSEP